MSGQLEGIRILVTGAATGIGAAAVEVFHEQGAAVAATYHRQEPAESAATRAFWLQGDLADADRADTTVGAAAEKLGGLDVLLHAAGTWAPGAPGEITAEHLDRMLDANLRTTVHANQSAYRLMRQQEGGGRIINLGSSEGVGGVALSAGYALAKGAVHSWTRSAAKAWGQHGITVNAVAPAVETPGSRRFREALGPQAEVFLQQMSRARPITGSLGEGRLGDPVRDLGPVLVFLAGPGAHFLTGQLLPVSGGSLMLGA